MPELPEVETVAVALDQALRGRRLRAATLLGRMRRDFDADGATALLAGRRVTEVRRRAKYIVIDCGGAGLLAHLGMTGSFRIEAADVPAGRHDRAAFRLDGGDELRFADARRFGFVAAVTLPDGGDPEELARLGPEPLARTFTGAFMTRRAEGRTAAVKAFIMDQRVVAGVGNIYASEALHAAGIDPRRPAGQISREEWRRAVQEIKAVLRRAVRKGGSTIRSYRTVDGSEGGFQRRLAVYGKAGQACPRCGGVIAVIRQCGRSTFFCPDCQG